MYALPAEIHTATENHGYPESMRRRALEMYVDGINLRRIARHLKIHHRTVSLWLKDHAETLPVAPVPEQVHTANLDELFTFIGDKKRNLHLDHCRSPNTLHFGLVCRLGSYPGRDSEDCRSSTQSEMVFQQWL